MSGTGTGSEIILFAQNTKTTLKILNERLY